MGAKAALKEVIMSSLRESAILHERAMSYPEYEAPVRPRGEHCPNCASSDKSWPLYVSPLGRELGIRCEHAWHV